jgi:hypothetical protein
MLNTANPLPIDLDDDVVQWGVDKAAEPGILPTVRSKTHRFNIQQLNVTTPGAGGSGRG